MTIGKFPLPIRGSITHPNGIVLGNEPQLSLDKVEEYAQKLWERLTKSKIFNKSELLSLKDDYLQELRVLILSSKSDNWGYIENKAMFYFCDTRDTKKKLFQETLLLKKHEVKDESVISENSVSLLLEESKVRLDQMKVNFLNQENIKGQLYEYKIITPQTEYDIFSLDIENYLGVVKRVKNKETQVVYFIHKEDWFFIEFDSAGKILSLIDPLCCLGQRNDTLKEDFANLIENNKFWNYVEDFKVVK